MSVALPFDIDPRTLVALASTALVAGVIVTVATAKNKKDYKDGNQTETQDVTFSSAPFGFGMEHEAPRDVIGCNHWVHQFGTGRLLLTDQTLAEMRKY